MSAAVGFSTPSPALTSNNAAAASSIGMSMSASTSSLRSIGNRSLYNTHVIDVSQRVEVQSPSAPAYHDYLEPKHRQEKLPVLASFDKRSQLLHSASAPLLYQLNRDISDAGLPQQPSRRSQQKAVLAAERKRRRRAGVATAGHDASPQSLSAAQQSDLFVKRALPNVYGLGVVGHSTFQTHMQAPTVTMSSNGVSRGISSSVSIARVSQQMTASSVTNGLQKIAVTQLNPQYSLFTTLLAPPAVAAAPPALPPGSVTSPVPGAAGTPNGHFSFARLRVAEPTIPVPLGPSSNKAISPNAPHARVVLAPVHHINNNNTSKSLLPSSPLPPPSSSSPASAARSVTFTHAVVASETIEESKEETPSTTIIDAPSASTSGNVSVNTDVAVALTTTVSEMTTTSVPVPPPIIITSSSSPTRSPAQSPTGMRKSVSFVEEKVDDSLFVAGNGHVGGSMISIPNLTSPTSHLRPKTTGSTRSADSIGGWEESSNISNKSTSSNKSKIEPAGATRTRSAGMAHTYHIVSLPSLFHICLFHLTMTIDERTALKQLRKEARERQKLEEKDRERARKEAAEVERKEWMAQSELDRMREQKERQDRERERVERIEKKNKATVEDIKKRQINSISTPTTIVNAPSPGSSPAPSRPTTRGGGPRSGSPSRPGTTSSVIVPPGIMSRSGSPKRAAVSSKKQHSPLSDTRSIHTNGNNATASGSSFAAAVSSTIATALNHAPAAAAAGSSSKPGSRRTTGASGSTATAQATTTTVATSGGGSATTTKQRRTKPNKPSVAASGSGSDTDENDDGAIQRPAPLGNDVWLDSVVKPQTPSLPSTTLSAATSTAIDALTPAASATSPHESNETSTASIAPAAVFVSTNESTTSTPVPPPVPVTPPLPSDALPSTHPHAHAPSTAPALPRRVLSSTPTPSRDAAAAAAAAASRRQRRQTATTHTAVVRSNNRNKNGGSGSSWSVITPDGDALSLAAPVAGGRNSRPSTGTRQSISPLPDKPKKPAKVAKKKRTTNTNTSPSTTATTSTPNDGNDDDDEELEEEEKRDVVEMQLQAKEDELRRKFESELEEKRLRKIADEKKSRRQRSRASLEFPGRLLLVEPNETEEDRRRRLASTGGVSPRNGGIPTPLLTHSRSNSTSLPMMQLGSPNHQRTPSGNMLTMSFAGLGLNTNVSDPHLGLPRSPRALPLSPRSMAMNASALPTPIPPPLISSPLPSIPSTTTGGRPASSNSIAPPPAHGTLKKLRNSPEPKAVSLSASTTSSPSDSITATVTMTPIVTITTAATSTTSAGASSSSLSDLTLPPVVIPVIPLSIIAEPDSQAGDVVMTKLQMSLSPRGGASVGGISPRVSPRGGKPSSRPGTPTPRITHKHVDVNSLSVAVGNVGTSPLLSSSILSSELFLLSPVSGQMRRGSGKHRQLSVPDATNLPVVPHASPNGGSRRLSGRSNTSLISPRGGPSHILGTPPDRPPEVSQLLSALSLGERLPSLLSPSPLPSALHVHHPFPPIANNYSSSSTPSSVNDASPSPTTPTIPAAPLSPSIGPSSDTIEASEILPLLRVMLHTLTDRVMDTDVKRHLVVIFADKDEKQLLFKSIEQQLILSFPSQSMSLFSTSCSPACLHLSSSCLPV
jgi:hypothetical protein